MKSNANLTLALALALVALGILLLYYAERKTDSTRANPVCFQGYGTWLSKSSLDDPVFSDKVALELMYGLDSLAACSIAEDVDSYKDTPVHSYFASLSFGDRISYEHRIVFIAKVNSGDNQKRYIVITQKISSEFRCPSCGPQLWAGEFGFKDGHWHTIVRPQFLIEYGEWGIFNDVPQNRELFQIGPDKYGILLKNVHYTSWFESKYAILIGEVNDSLVVVLEPTRIAEDGSGACMPELFASCWHNNSNIEFVQGENPDYFDLQILTQGTEADMDHWGQVKDAASMKIFKFKDGKYALANSN
ncbi:hypothetical protein ANRL1_03273 [Anaerolineae bacterium]|nr:hypothetical protein ANRL1_03273 [Anaerolineae bacterium]